MHAPSSIFNAILPPFLARIPNIKNSCLQFMMQTTLDFAPRAAHDAGDNPLRQNSDQSAEDDVGDGGGGIVNWNDSNHNFLLQQASGESGGLTALARDMSKMKEVMDPDLFATLENQKLLSTVGEGDTLDKDFIKILKKVTGVTKTDQEIARLEGGKFCITYDTILKLIAIFTRIRCNIPAPNFRYNFEI